MGQPTEYFYKHRGTLEPCAWWGSQQRPGAWDREMNITNFCIKKYLSFFFLAVLHLYQLNRSDMLNARKIQEFVMFISRLFLRYPREAFCLLIYKYNIYMGQPSGSLSR